MSTVNINFNFGQYAESISACEINGAKFAFITQPLNLSNFNVSFPDTHLIFLQPLNVSNKIDIIAKSVLFLGSNTECDNNLSIKTSLRTMLFCCTVHSKANIDIDSHELRAYGGEVSRFEEINKLFIDAISGQDWQKMWRALGLSYAVSKDSDGEQEGLTVSSGEILQFWDIPSQQTG